MKIDRQKVYQKCTGHCGYCGKAINFKDMQVDHIIPLWYISLDKTNNHLNNEDNLMPSCRSCNHYKRGDNLEQFRTKMTTLHDRVCSHYIGKVALDYNIVYIKPFDGVFYFEKIADEIR